MKKLLTFIKESYRWFFWILIGILLIVAPDIALLFDSNFNVEVLVKNNWNTIAGISLLSISFVALVLHWFYLHKYCIIRLDGLEGKIIPQQKLYLFGKKVVHSYSINLKNNQNAKNIYKSLCQMLGVFENNKQDLAFDTFCYYGFTYTPFIFKLGQLYGNTFTYKFFHMCQDTSGPKIKMLKKARKNFPELNKNFKGNNSEQLVIRVCTSCDINKMDTTQFGICDVLTFNSTETGFDVIDSLSKLEQWCDQITDTIRQIDLTKYEKINLLLATSSEMVFLLGKCLSKIADPNFYVFHFDNNASFKYPWAIVTKEEFEKSVYIFKK